MLSTALYNFLQDPKNELVNFKLGYEYELLGQTASAVSFYLRTAENTALTTLAYESIIRLGLCFKQQTRRPYSTQGRFQQAISILPNKPEAYFLLSQHYEQTQSWLECYTTSIIGQQYGDNYLDLQTDIGYPGGYGLLFEQAISAWWIGRVDESLQLLTHLHNSSGINELYQQAIEVNLQKFNKLENRL